MRLRAEASPGTTKRRAPTRTTVTVTPSAASERTAATSDARRSPLAERRWPPLSQRPEYGYRNPRNREQLPSACPQPEWAGGRRRADPGQGSGDRRLRADRGDRDRADHDRRPHRDRERRHLPALRRGGQPARPTQTELAGLPELTEKGAEKATEGAIEGVEDKVTPDSSGLRTAAKGAAAAAAVGAAAMAARELASRVGGDDKSGDTGDEG